ncbi:MAG: enoyl-CoA hydratase/isomerase family protein [Bdellovibrionales bacterium]|nr:enoyl-CoA hydratase/isomerase family protein [Bdellovibrionales bacterium]
MKHFNLHIKDGIALLEWNQKESSINLICKSFEKEFSSILKNLNLTQIKALILTSTKKGHFSYGADINEIKKCKQASQIEEASQLINQLFLDLEHLNIPKIVAIEGKCLGGALELALCFDYILVSQSSQTELCFPEIKLGFIPGFGACFRLPKRVGLLQALKMISTGKSIKAQKAFQIGLADEKVPELLLNKRALELAQEIIRTNAIPKTKKKLLHRVESFFKDFVFFLFKKKILEETKGFYKAPLKALSLIKKTYGYPISHKILKQQNDILVELLLSHSTQNLISLFLKTQRLKKDLSQDLKKQVFQKSIQKVAVLGAGTMGQSLAFLLIDKGFEVRLIDKNPSSLCVTLKKVEKLLNKQKKQNKITSYEKNHKRNLLSVSQSFSGLKNIDLVIEALPENFTIKKERISFVSRQLNLNCLFSSNTSSLSILELAKTSCHPDSFFGLHFFNPTTKIPLVELCYTDSQKEKLGVLSEFIKKLNKIPLIVKDSPGFVVNRVLRSYLVECLILVEEGWNIEDLDNLFREKGFPLGPFETMDRIGLDICLQTISNLEQKGLHLKKPKWTNEIVKYLGQGMKQKRGFYLYKDNTKSLNPKIEIFKKEDLTVKQASDEIFYRIVEKMAQTGEELIKENIVKTEEDIDIAMTLSIGFPAFLGGPMKYMKDHHKTNLNLN